MANICGRNSLSPPGTYFFLIPPFQSLGLKVVPSAEKGEDDVVSIIQFNLDGQNSNKYDACYSDLK